MLWGNLPVLSEGLRRQRESHGALLGGNGGYRSRWEDQRDEQECQQATRGRCSSRFFKALEVVSGTLKSLIATLRTLSVTAAVRWCALRANRDGNRSEAFIVT
jgi:hypothetical protein